MVTGHTRTGVDTLPDPGTQYLAAASGSVAALPLTWPASRFLPSLIGPDMSTMTKRLVLQLERLLDRLIVPDDRYACGGCDDRFVSRSLGIDHVLHCHPEYRGVVVYEDTQARLSAFAA